MKENDNIQLIKDHFAAFGKGDLQLALDSVADKVDWQSPATRSFPEKIPWAKPRRSKEEVFQFFKEMADKVQPGKFEIRGYTAQENKVVVEGSNSGTAKATHKNYAHDWVMVFDIAHGKIVRHRHYYDTADIAAAF